ncbi:MAG: TetR/AcrR family transcriptional regulator [Thermodesulfobacteriota bacterium]
MIERISKVISGTKAHKDIFAIPELIGMLRSALEEKPEDLNTRQEAILLFVQQATEALQGSPIYSDTLVRNFYRNVLDLADSMGVPREGLLEDLLFQSLRRLPSPEKPKRRIQQNARTRILEAALAEFSAQGFHNSTIDSIAERADIAKGTVYRYFKTKNALFDALKEDTITEFVELGRSELAGEEDVLKIIETVIRVYLSFFEKKSAIFKVIIQEQKDFGREFSDKFINELILAMPGLKRRCWKASREGRLKQMNYFTAFYGIIGFLNGVIQKWLHEGGEGSLQDEFATVKEVLFFGIVAGTGEPGDSKLRVIS